MIKFSNLLSNVDVGRGSLNAALQFFLSILRKSATFPSILLVGVRITDIGKSTAKQSYALFNPKAQDCGNAENLSGLEFNGCITYGQDEIYHKLAKTYEDSPCVTASSEIMFMDQSGNCVQNLQPDLIEQLQKIYNPSSKL